MRFAEHFGGVTPSSPARRSRSYLARYAAPSGRGGALKKLTVVATGEVFTANIGEQERPGLE
jgi:hypothetical protein